MAARPLAALFAVVGFACSPGVGELRARDPRPNLVLISMDTTRADRLSVYGYERDTTPVLRSFAEHATRFDSAYAASATTGPSHASLFTSLYPITHGVSKNGRRLASGFETMAEVLAAEGYETGAVVSSYVLSARFGYGQGFESYDEDFSQARTPSGVTLWEGKRIEGKFYGRADDTTRRALEWLGARRSPEKPFFLFVHYFDPHDPYAPPESFRPRFRPGREVALKLQREIFFYDTLIAYMDQQIGVLFDRLSERGLDATTAIVILGDHGEGLMQHGHLYHGYQIYEEAVRVPLLVHWPRVLAEQRVLEAPVALVDLLPTVLDLVGSRHDRGAMRGRSLAPRLRGEESGDPNRPIFLYRRHYDGEKIGEDFFAKGEKFGLRRGRFKLIDGPEEGTLELFDLEVDPGEKTNRARSDPERVKEMRAVLAQWKVRNARANPDAPALTDADRARLEALGYGD